MGSDGQQIMVIKKTWLCLGVCISNYHAAAVVHCDAIEMCFLVLQQTATAPFYDMIFVLLGVFSVSGVAVSGSPRPLGSLDEMGVCVLLFPMSVLIDHCCYTLR